MTATPRADCPGAWVVVSGDNVYDVFLGVDVSLPRCSCADYLWRKESKGLKCRHILHCEAL